MRISLIHPSRGRAGKAMLTAALWHGKSSGKIQIEHIVSVDREDKALYKYLAGSFQNIVVNHTSDVVSATNKAALKTTGDILIYLSDDFNCPENWDELLINKFKDINSPALIKVHDCLQKFSVPVLTIPIMNRALYNTLGYFWHPLYKSMFVDEDLYWTCHNNNWLHLAEELKFPHEHPCNGKSPNDETYRRSAANWDQGKSTYAKRKELNFPLK